MDSAKLLYSPTEHKWRASRDLELLLRRQNDPSKQLLEKELGNEDDVRERAIFVVMPCGVFFFLFSTFPRFLHSPALAPPLWWANLCFLAPCVLHIFGLHQTCIQQECIKLSPPDHWDHHHLSICSCISLIRPTFWFTDGRSQLENASLCPLPVILIHMNSCTL